MGRVSFIVPSNVVEVYYKTRFNVQQGFGAPIDLDIQTDEEMIAFAKSCEETQGPFQGPSCRWEPSVGASLPIQWHGYLHAVNVYSSVTQPSEASFTVLMYLYKVPRVTL